MTKKLMLHVDTVENHGLLVQDKLDIQKRYVFQNPYNFYAWLCEQMGVNAKPDSHTTDGRVVIDFKKLERLHEIQEAFLGVYKSWLNSEAREGPLDDALLNAERRGYFE